MEKTKARVLMTRAGQTAHYDADLVFLDGTPTLVVEWTQAPHADSQSEETPVVTISLDPRFLHELKGWGSVTHTYELPVVDPRPLH